MRCPKCGFHSFDYLDNCKKCGVDLTEQKLRFKYQGYVAPAIGAAAPMLDEVESGLPEVAEAENEAIDFGFDVLADDPAAESRFPYRDATPADDNFDSFAAVAPTAIDLAADSGLSLDEPFGTEDESLPSELPELDDRNNEFF